MSQSYVLAMTLKSLHVGFSLYTLLGCLLRYRDNWAVYHLNRMVYLCVLNVRAMVIVLCSKCRGGILLSNEMLSFQSDQHHFQDSRVQGTNTLKAIGLIRNVCMAADNKIEQHFGYFNV